MAGRITLWGAGEFLNTFFTKNTSAPPDFYLALIKDAPPTPYVSGAELDEPQVASYQRVPIPASSACWSNSGQLQVIANSVDVNFVTATEDWGTIRHWALCNAQVDGYVYAVGDLDQFTVRTGDSCTLYEGDLTIALGPFYTTEEI